MAIVLPKLTRPYPGIALTTAVQTIVENPANSGEVRTFELVWCSVDSANDAALPISRRAGATGLRQILSANYVVKRLETVTRIVVLAPGDRVEGSASATDDVVVDVQQILAEPV